MKLRRYPLVWLALGMSLVMAALFATVGLYWLSAQPAPAIPTAFAQLVEGDYGPSNPPRLVTQPELPPATADPTPLAAFRIYDLSEDYRWSVVAAEARYRGNYYDLTGDVLHVEQDRYGQYCVWFRVPGLREVVCSVRPGLEADFAAVKPNQMIRVRARVVGSRPADAARNALLELDDTRLLEAFGPPVPKPTG